MYGDMVALGCGDRARGEGGAGDLVRGEGMRFDLAKGDTGDT